MDTRAQGQLKTDFAAYIGRETEESIEAVKIPVMALVAPGPEVTSTTPALPVALA